jgi:plastocyanin
MKHTLALALAASLLSLPALAEDANYTISIKDHKFSPDRVEIPADTKVKLLVKNLDATAEEFESHELNREKVIQGKSEAPVFVGPLKPGEYKFFGEFHQDTAQGKIIVK